MKKLILLLFIPLVSFSQTPIRYYEDGYLTDSVGVIIFIALLVIFYFYYKNSDNNK